MGADMFGFGKGRPQGKPSPSLTELVQRTRILVIDDVESEFPFEILRKQGYSLDYWSDVEDLCKLEAGFYDIIILDIGGVATDLDSENEGAAILTHLKHVNPAQVVVAHSGQSHDSVRIPFFSAADQYVPKPVTALEWKEILDDLIATKLTVEYFWKAMESMMTVQGCSKRQIRKVETTLKKAALDGNIDASEKLRTIIGTVDNLATLTSLGLKIVGFWSL